MGIPQVYDSGGSVIVDFGDITIEISTAYIRHKIDISDVTVEEDCVVFFYANGQEDFISIRDTVFGEHPFYRPFNYTIIKDNNNIGVEGLHQRVKDLYGKE